MFLVGYLNLLQDIIEGKNVGEELVEQDKPTLGQTRTAGRKVLVLELGPIRTILGRFELAVTIRYVLFNVGLAAPHAGRITGILRSQRRPREVNVR